MPTLTTIFPPVPQTVWPISDPALERSLGTPTGAAWHVDASAQGLVTRGPYIALNAGLYGIEFQISPGEHLLDPETRVAVAQVTADGGAVCAESYVTIAQISQPYGGLY